MSSSVLVAFLILGDTVM